jgi:hypothetical protein
MRRLAFRGEALAREFQGLRASWKIPARRITFRSVLFSFVAALSRDASSFAASQRRSLSVSGVEIQNRHDKNLP